MLHFSCGAVAALRLAVAMEHERTYVLARTSGKTTARPPVFVCRSKQVQTSWIWTSRFLTEAGTALYNKATPEYSDKHCKKKTLDRSL